MGVTRTYGDVVHMVAAGDLDAALVCTEGHRHLGPTMAALRDEDAHFIDCIRRDAPTEIPRPEEAMRALEVTLALLRTADEGRPVTVQLGACG